MDSQRVYIPFLRDITPEHRAPFDRLNFQDRPVLILQKGEAGGTSRVRRDVVQVDEEGADAAGRVRGELDAAVVEEDAGVVVGAEELAWFVFYYL